MAMGWLVGRNYLPSGSFTPCIARAIGSLAPGYALALRRLGSLHVGQGGTEQWFEFCDYPAPALSWAEAPPKGAHPDTTTGRPDSYHSPSATLPPAG